MQKKLVICGASDRDRLYALYFKQKFEKIDTTRKYTFIDFAPCVVSKAIKKYPFLVYWSSDLLADNVDVKADLMEPPYRDNSVDIFLCSHILEHVEDDRKAMAELYRILQTWRLGNCNGSYLTHFIRCL